MHPLNILIFKVRIVFWDEKGAPVVFRVLPRRSRYGFASLDDCGSESGQLSRPTKGGYVLYSQYCFGSTYP